VSSGAIDLADYDVLGVNGGVSPGAEYRRTNLDSVSLAAGDYFVLGAAGVHNVDQVAGTTNIWQNGAPDAIAVVYNTTGDPDDDVLIDSVSYEGDTAGGPTGGGSWTETTGVSPGDNNSDYYVGLSRLPDGTDTDDNSSDLTLRCISPGETNLSQTGSCQAPGPSPTPTATGGASPTPTAGASPTPAGTATPTAAASFTPAASATPTDSASSTPTEAIPTNTAQATATETTVPSSSPEPTATEVAPPTATEQPLAVELTSFTASRFGSVVVVRWETESEIAHAGFRLFRSQGTGAPRLLTVRLIVPRSPGGELEGAKYRFVDSQPPAGAVKYWLDDLDLVGRATRHGPAVVGPILAGAKVEAVPGRLQTLSTDRLPKGTGPIAVP
jgi:hypothetical protein